MSFVEIEEIKRFLSAFLELESKMYTARGRENLNRYNEAVDQMKELILEELINSFAVNVSSFGKSGLSLFMILKKQPDYLERQKERAENYPDTPKRTIYKIEHYKNSDDEDLYAVYVSPTYNIVDFSNLKKPFFVEPNTENSQLLLITYIGRELKIVANYVYTSRSNDAAKKYYSTGGINNYSKKKEFWEFDPGKLGTLVERVINQTEEIPLHIQETNDGFINT